MKSVEEILPLVKDAVAEAEAMHPKFPADMVYAGAIVAEECGELTKAVNDLGEGKGTDFDVLTEALHTAVTAVRFLMNYEQMKKPEVK